jgi:hypothetical protein
MKLETFAMERLQSTWENRVAWNVSESGVHPLRSHRPWAIRRRTERSLCGA